MRTEDGKEIMTFTNKIKIGDKKISLDDFSEEEQIMLANQLIYRPLTTITNTEVIQTA